MFSLFLAHYLVVSVAGPRTCSVSPVSLVPVPLRAPLPHAIRAEREEKAAAAKEAELAGVTEEGKAVGDVLESSLAVLTVCVCVYVCMCVCVCAGA